MPASPSAAVLSIGDELVLGQSLDTNSRWLSDRLLRAGVVVREHATVADDLDRIAAALRRLAAAHPLVIATGGLGPTADDLTRYALARIMGEELVEDADALAAIRAIMDKRGRPLTDLQRTQALRPRSATMLANTTGTAPGIHAMIKRLGATASAVGRGGRPGTSATADSLEDSVAGRGTPAAACDVFCLPGPPGEMQPMFERCVLPRLRARAGAVLTRAIHCLGIAEADLAQRLGPLMNRNRNPLVGTTASGGIVSIRIRWEPPDPPESTPSESEAASDESSRKTRMLPAMDETVRACLDAAGPFAFGQDDDTIEAVVLDLLRKRGEQLLVAESCTAGGLGELFSRTPGSSEALLGGWITYSNEMKTAALGVPADLIARHGAVSEPVARAMAESALRNAPALPEQSRDRQGAPPSGRAIHALAITGVAGPTGGTDAKPVGAVFIARASSRAAHEHKDTTVEVRRFLIAGGRADVRDRSAKLALMMLRFHLLDLDVPRTLWQVQMDGTPFPSDPGSRL